MLDTHTIRACIRYLEERYEDELEDVHTYQDAIQALDSLLTEELEDEVYFHVKYEHY